MLRKILFLLMLSVFSLSNFCLAYEDSDVEHLNTLDYKVSPKVDLVKITPGGNVIQKDNLIIVNFANNFNSKYSKIGDPVQFTFENDIGKDLV